MRSGVEWWWSPESREYVASYREERLSISDVELYSKARDAHPITWPVMTWDDVSRAMEQAWENEVEQWAQSVDHQDAGGHR